MGVSARLLNKATNRSLQDEVVDLGARAFDLQKRSLYTSPGFVKRGFVRGENRTRELLNLVRFV